MKSIIRSWTNRALALLIGIALLSPAACALYKNDRCYVEEAKYKVAYNLFVESGSLDLVQRQLRDFQWQQCAINEAAYRLEKEFEVTER